MRTAQTQVDELRATPVSELSIDGATARLQEIKGSLTEIADAQPDLSAERQAEVDTAMQAFRGDVADTLKAAVAAGSTEGVEDALRTAADTLATGFNDAFGPVDCA